MQYYIETKRCVAITCDLNDSQAERFFRWVVSKKQGALFVPLYGAEGRALVVFSHQGTLDASLIDSEPKSGKELNNEARQCWDKDTRLWDNTKCLDEFYHKHHYEWSTKIYPKSAVPDDAPDDFIGKQRVRYKDLKDLKDRGVRVPPFIANYLQTAENIVGGRTDMMEDSDRTPANVNIVNAAKPIPVYYVDPPKDATLEPKDCPVEGVGGFWESHENYAKRIGVQPGTLRGYRRASAGARRSSDGTWGKTKLGEHIFKVIEPGRSNSKTVWWVRNK